MFIYPSNTALTFQSHSYSLQKMYKNTFQTPKLPTLKLPKCQKGPTTSHLLTASGRFKTSMATLQEHFDIKTIQETGLIFKKMVTACSMRNQVSLKSAKLCV